MSNHYHLLITVKDARQLASFMNVVQSNLAREAGRLARWREKFWSRRYQAILVSEERDAQLSRLRYILSQGCKEGLVARPEQWRGAHCVRELLSGESTLSGIWIDRTSIHRHGGYRRTVVAAQFVSNETLHLRAMPCFADIDEAGRREWIRGCVDAIADDARRESRARNRGAGARPRSSGRRDSAVVQPMKRTAAPWFHVASANEARELHVTYRLFIAIYRSAAEKLKRGLDAVFPEGCFPPARPYVPLPGTE
jgi:hypothetical protein